MCESELKRNLALITLIGLPGGGKTTTGRQLARRLAAPFLDTDAVIEERLGMSIRDYFEREGEEPFRNIEEQVVSELVGRFDGVLATGGGVVLRAANREALRNGSTVVYLMSTPEALFRRLRSDTRRPLLQTPRPMDRLKELHAERDHLYRETAHFEVATGRPSVPAIVTLVLAQLELAGVVDAAQVPSTVDPVEPCRY